MYYFLALTLQEDVTNGTFWPSYVLCKAHTTSESRSGWRIIKQLDGTPSFSLPRVLVTELTSHDDMVLFMSSYQTQDKKGGKHYHPRGYLCWYECDRYGDPTGIVYVIKKVPEYVWIFNFKDKGFQRLKRDRAKVKTLQEVLSAEPRMTPLNTTDVKCKLHQSSHRQDLQKEKQKRK